MEMKWFIDINNSSWLYTLVLFNSNQVLRAIIDKKMYTLYPMFSDEKIPSNPVKSARTLTIRLFRLFYNSYSLRRHNVLAVALLKTFILEPYWPVTDIIFTRSGITLYNTMGCTHTSVTRNSDEIYDGDPEITAAAWHWLSAVPFRFPSSPLRRRRRRGAVVVFTRATEIECISKYTIIRIHVYIYIITIIVVIIV